MINQDPPATCGDAVVSAVEQSATALGLSHKTMVSRAYHDSLFMALLMPTGMIFVPCRGGFSHRPDEFVEDEHIVAGVQARAHSLALRSPRSVQPRRP